MIAFFFSIILPQSPARKEDGDHDPGMSQGEVGQLIKDAH